MLDALLEDLRVRAKADAAVLSCPAVRHARPVFARLHATGHPPLIEAALMADAQPLDEVHGLDDVRQALHEFHLNEGKLDSPGALTMREGRRRFQVLCPIPRHEQVDALPPLGLGTFLTLDDRVLGWVGLYGKHPMNRRLDTSLDALRQGLLSDAVERSSHPAATGTLLLRDGQTMAPADEAGKRWAERDGFSASLVKQIAENPTSRTMLVEGALVKLVALEEAGLTILNVSPVKLLPLPAARTLSHGQRIVADYLAHGATVAQIATSLGVQPSTTETHKRDVYKRMNVTGRVEIKERLEQVD